MPNQNTTFAKMLVAFSEVESRHYENRRERANAIALSGENELRTRKAMHEHAKKVRAALRYDTTVPISSVKAPITTSCAGLSPAAQKTNQKGHKHISM